MPKHQINLKIPKAIEVVNRDIEVVVYEDDRKLGRLRISRGTIDWTPASGKNARHMSWTTFARMMEKNPPRRVHS
jgi:hypothetical protein